MRWNRPIAWTLFAISVALVVLQMVLLALDSRPPTGTEQSTSVYVATVVAVALFVLAFAAVGGLIASRFPANAVGWLCIAIGLSWAIAGSGLTYLEYSTRVSELPAARFALITQVFWNAGGIIPATLLPLVFPTGRPPSPRWRWVARATAITIGLFFLSGVIAPTAEYPVLDNPYEITALGGVATAIQTISAMALLVVAVASFASLILRMRRAGSRERQQLKWLLFSVALVVVVMMVATIFESLGTEQVGNLLVGVASCAVPVAIGVAILRYRLYDIDIIVNRTLVYGLLTLVLGLCYFAIVVVLQILLEPVTRESDLAIAASTLVVATLFRPVRSRIQDFIDARFYRRKYDATATLDVFSARLRDELDLQNLGRELVEVVATTMQPTHASVWLRDPKGGTT